MELETLNRLYLELSQVATATTQKEIERLQEIGMARSLAIYTEIEIRNGNIDAAAQNARQLSERLNDMLPTTLLPGLSFKRRLKSEL